MVGVWWLSENRIRRQSLRVGGETTTLTNSEAFLILWAFVKKRPRQINARQLIGQSPSCSVSTKEVVGVLQ